MLRTNSKGFTLIELMIVVAIIAIIAAIAIPNLLRARISANEASAIGALRTIASAQATAQQSARNDADNDGIGEYMSLSQLGSTPGGQPAFIDPQLASSTKSGYSFTITTTGAANSDEVQWWAQANPIQANTSGVRTFYIDESGVLRASNANGAAAVRGGPAPAFPANYNPVGG